MLVTVAEFMKLLSVFPPDAEVCIGEPDGSDSWITCDIEHVTDHTSQADENKVVGLVRIKVNQ